MTNPNMQQPVNQPGQFPQGFNPQYVPAPMMPPQGQPLAPPAGMQPQQPQQPAPQQPPQSLLDARIPQGDPQWPKELWGRPVRDAMRFYNVMADDFRRRNLQQQGQPQQPQPQQQFQQQPQPSQQQFQQPQQPQQSQLSADTQQMINTAIQSALTPYTQVSAEIVRNRVAARFRDWWQYDAGIMEALQGAGPEVLMQDSAWEAAYYLTKGKSVSQQQVQPYQPQPQQPPNGYGYAGAPIITPPPPPPGMERPYFSEAPTAPSPNAAPADLTTDPNVIMMARKFGMSPQEMAQYWNGNVPAQTQPQGNGRGF